MQKHLSLAWLALLCFLSCEFSPPSSSEAPNAHVPNFWEVDSTAAGSALRQALALKEKALFDSAQQYFVQAVALYAEEERWQGWVKGMNQMALNQLDLEQLGQANTHLDSAFEKAVEVLGEQHELVAENHYVRAQIYFDQGDYASAKIWTENALSLQVEQFGQAHEAVFRSYNLLASAFFYVGEVDSAEVFYQKALAAAQRSLGETHRRTIGTYSNLGMIEQQKGNLLEASSMYQKALDAMHIEYGASHPSMGQMYQNLAAVQIERGIFDKANFYLQQAFKVYSQYYGPDHGDLASVYYMQGAMGQTKGDWDQAQHDYDQALGIFRKIDPQHLYIPLILNGKGAIYSEQGNHTDALTHFDQALHMFQQKGNPLRAYIADVHRNLGKMHLAQGNFSLAKDHYEHSLEFLTTEVGEDHPWMGEVLNELGHLYLEEGKDMETALAYFQHELRIKKSLQGEAEGQLSHAYLGVGKTYTLMGRRKEALQHLKMALDNYRLYYGEKNRYAALSYQALGNYYQTQYNFSKALDNYEKALNALALHASSWYASTEIRKKGLLDPYVGMDILQDKATTHIQLAEQSPNSLKEQERAFEAYSSAIALRHELSASFSRKESRYGLTGHIVYEKALELLWKLYAEKRESAYASLALEVMEQGKSHNMLQALREMKAREFAGIPSQLLRLERELALDIAHYTGALQREKIDPASPPAKAGEELAGILFQKQNRYDSLIRVFDKRFPTYFELTQSQQAVNLKELQRRIRNAGSALISYYQGESHTYILALDGKNIHLFEPLPTHRVLTAMEAFEKGMLQLEYERFLHAGHELYSLLVKPMATLLEGHPLIIIPDGDLRRLAFETLLSQPQLNKDKVAEWPYLIKSHEITYAYAASLLKGQEEDKPKKAQGFWAFAPVNFVDLPELAASEAEVLEIAKMFRDKGLPTQVLLRERAREAALRSDQWKDARFLHISSHTFLDPEIPQLTGIALHPPNQTSKEEDGTLYTPEAYSLSIGADLVVLSSCNSKIGKQEKGEGMMGLSRAFMYAGGNNLIASLWEVEDAATAQLMYLFYEEVLNGLSYSQALRRAKLALINNPNLAYPLDWGAFVLIGN